MDPDRFRRVADLFYGALEREVDEREEYLREVCGDDDGLRLEVERLLLDDRMSTNLVELYDPFPGDERDPLVGELLGPWCVVEKIASGGMGNVYRARRADGLFEQEVAVKLLRARIPSKEMLERFDAERHLLARLVHPNVGRLLDGGSTASGVPYLVMEFIDGLPIDRHCEQERLSLEERLELFITVCHTVHFAHRNLVLHRDLKPNNLLVDRHGTVKLVDFGVARILDLEAGGRTGPAAGLTPEYASPEQLRGEPLSTASDVWSLGVVLHELLTGRRPIRPTSGTGKGPRPTTAGSPLRPSTAVSETDGETGTATGSGDVAAAMRSTPAKLRRRLRGDLDRIVIEALQPEPANRYASAEQLAEDLERHLRGWPVLARESGVVYRTRCFVRRNRLAVAAAVAVLVALCWGLLATWIGQQRAEQAAEHARIESDSFRLTAGFLSDTLLDAIPGAGGSSVIAESVARQADIVRRQHSEAPHLRANLLDALGRICMRAGVFDRAEELMTEALDIRQREFGSESLEMALSLNSLGELGYRTGDYEQAERHLRRSLDLHRGLPEDVHSDPATAANDLAAVLRRLGRLDEARALHEDALARRQGAEEPNELSIAESLNNLAIVCLEDREPQPAAERAGESVAIRKRILGPEHALTLQAMNTLAAAAWQCREVERAESLLREVAQGYRALGAAGVEELARTLSNVAAIAVQRGDLDRAEAPAREAVDLLRDRFGPDHPQVAIALDRLAAIATRKQDWEAAMSLWQEIVRIRREALPQGHPLLAEARLSLGTVILRGGALEEAEAVLRDALRAGGSYGQDKPSLLAQVEMELGACLAMQGRTVEARELLERALRRFEETEGPDSAGARAAKKRLDALQG